MLFKLPFNFSILKNPNCFLKKQFIRFLLIIIFMFLFNMFISTPAYAQCDDILVVKLKSGKEYVGRMVLDTDINVLKIKTIDRELLEIPFSEVEYVSTYQEVKYKPEYLKPCECSGCDIPCRRFPWYYMLELRGIGLYGKKFYYGGEAVFGFRPGLFSFGVGASALMIKDTLRIPVFLHLKYTFSEKCINPYIFGDVGYVFDKIVSDFKLKPSFNGMFKEPAPKMFGIGAGLDFVLTEYMDLSFDVGYRFFTLPTKHLAKTCDGPLPVLGFTEYHMIFARLGLTF